MTNTWDGSLTYFINDDVEQWNPFPKRDIMTSLIT